MINKLTRLVANKEGNLCKVVDLEKQPVPIGEPIAIMTNLSRLDSDKDFSKLIDKYLRMYSDNESANAYCAKFEEVRNEQIILAIQYYKIVE